MTIKYHESVVVNVSIDKALILKPKHNYHTVNFIAPSIMYNQIT